MLRTDHNHIRNKWASGNVAPPYHDFKSNAITLLYHGLDHQSLSTLNSAGESDRESDLSKDV